LGYVYNVFYQDLRCRKEGEICNGEQKRAVKLIELLNDQHLNALLQAVAVLRGKIENPSRTFLTDINSDGTTNLKDVVVESTTLNPQLSREMMIDINSDGTTNLKDVVVKSTTLNSQLIGEMINDNSQPVLMINQSNDRKRKRTYEERWSEPVGQFLRRKGFDDNRIRELLGNVRMKRGTGRKSLWQRERRAGDLLKMLAGDELINTRVEKEEKKNSNKRAREKKKRVVIDTELCLAHMLKADLTEKQCKDIDTHFPRTRENSKVLFPCCSIMF